MVSEETAKRIADALERLAAAVEANPWMRVPTPPQPVSFDPNRCGYCGGHHGLGMMCPKLVPGNISNSAG